MTQMYKTGAHLVLLKSDVNFDNNDDPPGVGRNEVNAEEAGLGLSLGYDNRDNLFTPGQGMFAEIKATHYDDVLYGDFKYDKIKGKIYSYFPIHPRWVQGLRLDGQFINGNSPFYAEPYINMRGIPAMRCCRGGGDRGSLEFLRTLEHGGFLRCGQDRHIVRRA